MPADEMTLLPSPPSDAERDSYLGPQMRWVMWVQFFGFALVALSILMFVRSVTWTAFILLPLAGSTVAAVLSLYSSSRPRRVGLKSHRLLVSSWKPTGVQYPSVDVFLPSAGEEMEVLENTYKYVSAMEWDGAVNVYVLDDSAREEVGLLALEYGFHYKVRANRGHMKKAGNLLFGYEHSQGDFILILDADFVPRHDFLRETIPYFDDASVGIVQTPQYFDIDKRMNWIQRSAGSTQILFYRWVQQSRDRYNAAICVGTCAVYRRKALQAAGGFAQIGHSEDVHTGIKLRKAGYYLKYVATVASKGLCPDRFNQFLSQQYRWCTGSMSLLADKSFHKHPMPKRERVSYYSGFLYYITTSLDVFFAWVPPIVLGLFHPEQVKPANYVFVIIALIARQSLVPIITMGKGSFIDLSRIQMTYSFAHAVAVWDVVRGRTEGWVATGAAKRSTLTVRVRSVATSYIIGVQLLMWSAVLINGARFGWLNWSLMLAFTVLNLVVAGPIALGKTIDDLPKMALPRRREVTIDLIDEKVEVAK